MAYIAYQIIAEVSDHMSFEEREEIDRKIRAALGCIQEAPVEENCPMQDMASTVVPTVEAAYKWLH